MDSLVHHAWSEDGGDAAVVESPSEFLLDLREAGKAEVAKVVVGHADAVELLLVAAVAGGHVLLEGSPGVAKTLLAGAVARVLGVRFTRVQFTPDTTPSEIAGSTARRLGEETFVPGAVFTNVLLADEINRTPPKTQASLLEAMQEGHVTVDGRTRWLPRPFMVIATQNPYEMEGVFPLPESQLDRFLFKIVLNYCTEEEEGRMLRLPHRGVTPDVIEEVRPLLDPVRLAKAQAELDATVLPDDVAKYLIAVVRRTRELPNVRLGGSPRSAIHLMSAARARARLAGRDHVTRDDVAEMALPVLRHRLVVEGTTSAEAVAAALAAVG